MNNEYFDAALQASRNTTGVGIDQQSALDVYAGSGGQAFRVWVDAPSFAGGKVPGLYIDSGANLSLLTSQVISGHLSRYAGNPNGLNVLLPTRDPFMLGLWADVNGGALYIAPNGYTHSGQPGYQDIVTMDNANPPNVRFALDGSGKLQWAAPNSNTYAGATWDTDLYRSDAGILQTDGQFVATSVTTVPTVTAHLPPCSSGVNGGMWAAISDNSESCSYGAVPSAGGSITCPVFCDGSRWTVH